MTIDNPFLPNCAPNVDCGASLWGWDSLGRTRLANLVYSSLASSRFLMESRILKVLKRRLLPRSAAEGMKFHMFGP